MDSLITAHHSQGLISNSIEHLRGSPMNVDMLLNQTKLNPQHIYEISVSIIYIKNEHLQVSKYFSLRLHICVVNYLDENIQNPGKFPRFIF